MNKLFTAEQKDRVLNAFADRCAQTGSMSFAIDTKKLGLELGLSSDLASSLVEYFAELGLLEFTNTSNTVLWINASVKLFDLTNRGGFTAIDQMALVELQKIQLEIEALRSDLDRNKFDKVMGSIQLLSAWLKSFVAD